MTPDTLAPFIGALLIAVVCVWLFARLATRIGAVSKVKNDRWHTSGEVPRLAGPAMLIEESVIAHAGKNHSRKQRGIRCLR